MSVVELENGNNFIAPYLILISMFEGAIYDPIAVKNITQAWIESEMSQRYENICIL